MIIGVDAGRFKVKVWHAVGFFEFYSNLGEYREQEFRDSVGKDDMVGEYNGRRFSAGTLAVRESEYGDSMMTDSKLHEDTVILILIALFKAGLSGQVKLVTGLPIHCHDKDKAQLKRMLSSNAHRIIINGAARTFAISCEVAPEGCGFFKFAEAGKTVRGLNIGSRTVNAITFRDEAKIGKESDTFDYGTESGKSRDRIGMARSIAAKTGALKWKRDDEVLMAGGGAIEVCEHLQQYYPNARIVNNPILMDAEAFYKTACEIYG